MGSTKRFLYKDMLRHSVDIRVRSFNTYIALHCNVSLPLDSNHFWRIIIEVFEKKNPVDCTGIKKFVQYADTSVFSMFMKGWIGWIIATLLIIIKLASSTEREKSLNSHKTNSMSHIPWNMLLDPNYTSQKKTSTMNHTFQSPSRHEISSLDTSTLHPHHSYNYKEPASPVLHYATPFPSQFSHSYDPPKYKAQHPSDIRPQRIELGQFSPALPSRPLEKIVFPSNQGHQTRRPEVLQRQTIRPVQKNKITLQDVKKDEKRKQSVRKPSEYFDSVNNDYMDNYYSDYDYSSESERVSYKPPKRQSQSYYSNMKGAGDPLGLLPSASDPDGFFSKAKDLLKGESYGKPSYSATNDYYSQYPPNKHYGEPEHSYYNDDGYGGPGYPIKNEYYGPSGYDYDSPIDEKYAGVYPYPDKRKGSKYGPLAFALGLLPLGLLLASLVPTVVTIPVTTAVATGRRRKRSIRFINPALEIISSYDMSALEDPVCMKQIFCKVVRDGKKDDSSIVQKFYYKLAYVLDEKISEFIGMKGIVNAVRKDTCQDFHCNTKRRLFHASPKNNTSVTNS
ncbi:uncharacterized protein NPIL_80491 [Nephila pilipes]|uniref:Uncharacterized protein n=1 Tax=Nephila pilipes TaxID=299642 RepID=A0A8X6TAP8_NEPPI|nr:uncharacterized protein NPIL_80491 [Nephila pilipes]